jgi:hypothetical protein
VQAATQSENLSLFTEQRESEDSAINHKTVLADVERGSRSDRLFARKLEIARLCKEGLNGNEIAAIFGLSRQRVWQIVTELGLHFTERKWERKCLVCGKSYIRFRTAILKNQRSFCSQECYHSVRQARKYIQWRHGCRLARKVVSKYFKLNPGNVVHHHDGDNRNNRLSNLAVFATNSDHIAHHHGISEVKPLWDGRKPGDSQ